MLNSRTGKTKYSDRNTDFCQYLPKAVRQRETFPDEGNVVHPDWDGNCIDIYICQMLIKLHT